MGGHKRSRTQVRPPAPVPSRTTAPARTFTRQSLLRLLLWVVPLLLTAGVFSGILHDAFTNWDDTDYVTANGLIHSLSFGNICRIFSPHSLVSGSYQPLTILSLAVNFAAGKLDPSGYLATNILLHLLNVLLVFVFIRLLLRNDLAAGLGALLFGIHPMHVESVAWVTGRKDLVFTLFYLSTLIAYFRYLNGKGRHRTAWYWTAFLCGGLSLLSKSGAVTLPFALFLVDYYTRRTWSKGMVVDKLPFLVAVIPAAIVAVTGQQTAALLDPTDVVRTTDRFYTGISSYLFYVVKFFLPLRLSAYYPYPDPALTVPASAYLLPLLSIAATGALLYWRRRSRVVVFGVLFFLVNVIFILHFVPVGRTAVADRFSYISSIGPAFIVSFYVGNAFRRRPSKGIRPVLLAAGIICVTAVLCMASRNRCSVWKNSVSLWSDVHKQFQDPVVLNNLGSALLDSGKPDEALAHFTRALELNPKFVRALYNSGRALSQKGLSEQAIAAYTAAIGLSPSYIDVFIFRGKEYERRGVYETALADYTEAIRLNPRCAIAYANRGSVFFKLRRTESALADFSMAMRLDPGLAETYVMRGALFSAQGNDAGALRDFATAIALDRGIFEAYYNRGVLHNRRGENDAAIADFTRAITLNPRYAPAYTGRAVAFGMKGALAPACADLDRSIGLDSANAETYFNRGLVFMNTGSPEKALCDFTKAVSLAPSFVQAYNNLGAVHMMLHRPADALADYDAALRITPHDAGLAKNREYVLSQVRSGKKM